MVWGGRLQRPTLHFLELLPFRSIFQVVKWFPGAVDGSLQPVCVCVCVVSVSWILLSCRRRKQQYPQFACWRSSSEYSLTPFHPLFLNDRSAHVIKGFQAPIDVAALP